MVTGCYTDLANLWIEAKDRQIISNASDEIDRSLANDPKRKTIRVDNLFSLRADPLVVLCDIRDDDRIVEIIEVHATI